MDRIGSKGIPHTQAKGKKKAPRSRNSIYPYLASPPVSTREYDDMGSVIAVLQEKYNFPAPSEETRELPYVEKLRRLVELGPHGVKDALDTLEAVSNESGKRWSGRDGTRRLLAEFDNILELELSTSIEFLSDRDISLLPLVGWSGCLTGSRQKNCRRTPLSPAEDVYEGYERTIIDTDSDDESFHSCSTTPPPSKHTQKRPALNTSLSSSSTSSTLPFTSPSILELNQRGNGSTIQASQRSHRTENIYPVLKTPQKTPHLRQSGSGEDGHRLQQLSKQSTKMVPGTDRSFHAPESPGKMGEDYSPPKGFEAFEDSQNAGCSTNKSETRPPCDLSVILGQAGRNGGLDSGGADIDYEIDEAILQKQADESREGSYPYLPMKASIDEGEAGAYNAVIGQQEGEGAPSVESMGDFNDNDDDEDLYGTIDIHEVENLPALSPAAHPLPSHHFAVQYEATRVALARKIQPDNAIICSYLNEYCDDIFSAEEYCDKWEILTRFHPGAKNLGRTSEAIWTSLKSESGWSDNVYLAGSVKFGRPKPGLESKIPLEITLNPLQKTRGNRFFNRFGSDRFLTLELPSFQGLSGVDAEKGRSQIIAWLAEEELKLLNRTWKVFYIKNGRNNRGKNETESSNQAIFFAIEGVGIGEGLGEEELQVLGFKDDKRKLRHEMSAQELLGWHIPLEVNMDEKVSKIWSRISLGFSDGTPTVTVNPSLIEFVRDFKSPINMVMDDGCSVISPALMGMVRQKLGADLTPTAVQARIGGAKGVWMVDPDGDWDSNELYIKITDSQLKYKGFDNDEDWARLTLDVLDSSHDPMPSRVNTQLIPILVNRGVPFSVMKEVLEEHLEGDLKELFQIIDEPISLRKWLYDRGGLARERARSRNMVTCGSLPESLEERAILMLESGFSVRGCEMLWFIVLFIIKQYLDDLKSKLRIRVSHSTRLFCVADPTCTLEEGEVSLRFSNGILDPKTMRRRTIILGDILVARNPAHLPSDIQKVKAVDVLDYHSPKMRNLQDVIVFSVKGDTSLASLLSGGDYDGDKPWVCWDERIVGPFKNGDRVSDQDRELILEGDFEKSSQRMADLEPHVPGFFNRFLTVGIANSLEQSFLGLCTSAWERICYRNDISDPGAIRLAIMCSFLVDAPKQGLSIRATTKEEIKKLLKLPRPAWKDPKNCEGRLETSTNVIDQLHFVAEQKVEEMKIALNDLKRPVYDPMPAKLYHEVVNLADAETGRPLRKVLEHLLLELDGVHELWKKLSRPGKSRKFNSAAISSCYSKFRKIMPPEDLLKDPVISCLVLGADSHFSSWSLLRASTAWYKWHLIAHVFLWDMAGREICFIKSQAAGRGSEFGPRAMIEEMYIPLKTMWGYEGTKKKNLAVGEGDDDDE